MIELSEDNRVYRQLQLVDSANANTPADIVLGVSKLLDVRYDLV